MCFINKLRMFIKSSNNLKQSIFFKGELCFGVDGPSN